MHWRNIFTQNDSHLQYVEFKVEFWRNFIGQSNEEEGRKKESNEEGKKKEGSRRTKK